MTKRAKSGLTEKQMGRAINRWVRVLVGTDVGAARFHVERRYQGYWEWWVMACSGRIVLVSGGFNTRLAAVEDAYKLISKASKTLLKSEYDFE